MFQKIIEDTLSGLHCNGVVAFQDDICVTGPNREVHLSNLKTVLSRLQRAGLRIKFEKCEFFKDEVCYLGYKINKHGLHTDSNKIDAIVNAPVPSNVSQLRAALGLINYYARFIPNMSSILQPLYSLLKKGTHWKWTRECDEAYCAIKDVLIREPVLAHYDPSLPLVLAVDSSSYGLGAVLSHVYPDGTERIVCCASRTLNDAERRYSQIDKEALAIVYGVTRHHQYVYGRHFTLKTDHMALSYIFGPKRGIPQTAASRLQRYAVRLAAYDFDIKFVSTERNSNADALSRLPLQKHRSDSEHDDAAYLHFVEDTFPLSHRDIAKETRKDVILCKIFGYIMSGWPEHIEIESEKPYFNRKDSLHVDHGCIIWGYRIAIPRTLRSQILDELHSGHMGIVRMKQIARNYVWWPNIDADIEARARGCLSCASVRDAPPAVAPVPYIWPASPWSRLHADFLQHNGKYFLLIIDAHSKWLEVFHMHDGTTAIQVIAKFRECFARFGIPKQVVTDGGPPFTSQEFENFLRRNGTKHIVTAPYHPSSNGAAENAVKTVKKALKKAVIDGEHIDRALCKFLLQYRNTAHTSTNQEPAVAMLGRTLRTRLDLLRNCTADHVEKAQETQVRLSKNSAERHVDQGDSVLVRNYSKNNANKWRPGTVVERTGAVTYKIQTGDTLSTKHIDQILPLRKSYRFSMPAALESDNEPIVESESDHLADSSPNPAEIETKDLKLAENIPGTRECSPPKVKTYNLRPRPIRSNRNNKD